jgi:hypothetical protein
MASKRDPQEARYDLIPAEALDAMAKAFAIGEAHYGRYEEDPTLPNWAGCEVASGQSPLSHAMKHLARAANGCQEEDHLANAMANVAMMIYFRDAYDSPYYQLTYPEILADDPGEIISDTVGLEDPDEPRGANQFLEFLKGLTGKKPKPGSVEEAALEDLGEGMVDIGDDDYDPFNNQPLPDATGTPN